MKREKLFQEKFNFMTDGEDGIKRSELMYYGLKDLVAGRISEGNRQIEKAISLAGKLTQSEKEQLRSYIHSNPQNVLNDYEWYYSDYKDREMKKL
jgi:hypothetical protein